MPGRNVLADPQSAALDNAVAQLRAEFDRGFTLAPPPAADQAGQCDFVLLSAGATRYALSTAGLAGIERAAAVTAAPSRVPALLGLAGVRGAIVPVFSLAGLLGLSTQPDEAWWRAPLFALASIPGDAASDSPPAPDRVDGQAIGLAFDRLLHFVRVPAADLLHGGHRTSLQHRGELFVVLTAQELIQPLLASAPVPPPFTENRHP